MHKETTLEGGCLVLRVATNRRVAWQAGEASKARKKKRRAQSAKRVEAASSKASGAKIVPLEGKTEVLKFQRRRSNFSNQ